MSNIGLQTVLCSTLNQIRQKDFFNKISHNLEWILKNKRSLVTIIFKIKLRLNIQIDHTLRP